MTARNWLWIAVAAVIVLGVAYLFTAPDEGSGPGQPAPHAVDQSQ